MIKENKELSEEKQRYESVKEELGCTIEVVWKATNDGFYTIGGKHFANYMNDITREECSIVFRPMKYDNEIVAIVGKKRNWSIRHLVWIQHKRLQKDLVVKGG